MMSVNDSNDDDDCDHYDIAHNIDNDRNLPTNLVLNSVIKEATLVAINDEKEDA